MICLSNLWIATLLLRTDMLITVVIILLLFTFQANANSPFSRAKVSKRIIHDGGYVQVMLGSGLSTAESFDNKTFFVLETSN